VSKKQLVLSLIIALSLFSICILKVVQGQTETTLIVEVINKDDNKPLGGLQINVQWPVNVGAEYSEWKHTNNRGIAAFSNFGDYEGEVKVFHYAEPGEWTYKEQTVTIKKSQTSTVRLFLEEQGDADPLDSTIRLLIVLIVALVGIAFLLVRRRNVI